MQRQDPEMPDLAVSEIYHEATKYTLEGIRVRAVPINLEDRPPAHKSYVDSDSEDLNLDDLESPLIAKPTATVFSKEEISQLLGFSYGVTARIGPEPETLFLRAAPSAGGLYPTELYLVLGEGHGYKAGVYNYQGTTHTLVRVIDRDESKNILSSLACSDELESCSAFIVLTGIFERSAWRYEDRAYRRMLLDTGHLLGNVLLTAEKLGRKAIPIAGFHDQTIAHTLLLDHHVEASFVVVPLMSGDSAADTIELTKRSLASDIDDSSANTSVMRHLHKVSSIRDMAALPEAAEQVAAGDTTDKSNSDAVKATDSSDTSDDESAETVAPIQLDTMDLDFETSLEEVLVRRRSARQFAGLEIDLSDLNAALSYGRSVPQRMAPDFVESYLLVHNVEGLGPGIYRYHEQTHCLELLSQGDFRDDARNFCLGQDLASESAAVLVHLADLKAARAAFGERAYRYLHLDSGHIGQRINLMAVSRDLGVSGIAGFFDDDINELLEVDPEKIVLYITTLGIPSVGEDLA